MKLIFIFAVLIASATASWGQTIVERHGRLKAEGNRIKDSCGRNAQVKGMSFFWSQWPGYEYYNADAVKWLRDDWSVQVVRAALAVRGAQDDYIGSPDINLARVINVLDGAVTHGIYGIADFHAHYASNYTKGAATNFFRAVSARYSGKPNIIYEIWNEPIGQYGDDGARATWVDIKSYAKEIISVIRDNDPENLIVVGTPFYDQRPDIAAEDPLTIDAKGRPVGNVAYSIHAYAGAHRQAIRDYGQKALDRGLALFMTESGRDGTNYGPNNTIDPAEWDRWDAWMNERSISFTKWSLSNKDETGSSLQPNASASGGWTADQLRPEGQWNRSYFRAANASPAAPCDNQSKDKIASITAPESVSPGSVVDVKIDYTASTDRDIRFVFQLNKPPYTVYDEKKYDAKAGSASIIVPINIPSDLPLGKDLYKFEVFIAPDGGDWASRLMNSSKINVDAQALTTPVLKKYVNIFDESLSSAWSDWSWGGDATSDDKLSKFGSRAYKYNFGSNGAVSFRHPDGVGGRELAGIEFWARTWSGSASFSLRASHNDKLDSASPPKEIVVDPTYRYFFIPKAELGNYNWYKRFFLQTSTGASIYLDNVKLVFN
jgi:endoglucanase